MAKNDPPKYPCEGTTEDGKPCREDLYPEIVAAINATATPNLNIIATDVPSCSVTEPSDALVTLYTEKGARYLLLAGGGRGAEPRLQELTVECTNCGTLWSVTYRVPPNAEEA